MWNWCHRLLRARGRVETAHIWRNSRDTLIYEDESGRRVLVSTERFAWGRVVYADSLLAWSGPGDSAKMSDEDRAAIRRRIEIFLERNRITYRFE